MTAREAIAAHYAHSQKRREWEARVAEASAILEIGGKPQSEVTYARQ